MINPAADSPITSRRRRLTQPERSAATRAALLESTIDCLAELGYDRATTAEISERAALSRGAHLHHYRTRQALLAAAADVLAERGQADMERLVAALPRGRRRTAAALEMVRELYTGPLFQAMLELAVHARTDAELGAALGPIQRRIERYAWPLLREAFASDPTDRSRDAPIAVAITTIRGLSLMPVLDPDGDPDRQWRSSRSWLLEALDGA